MALLARAGSLPQGSLLRRQPLQQQTRLWIWVRLGLAGWGSTLRRQGRLRSRGVTGQGLGAAVAGGRRGAPVQPVGGGARVRRARVAKAARRARCPCRAELSNTKVVLYTEQTGCTPCRLVPPARAGYGDRAACVGQ